MALAGALVGSTALAAGADLNLGVSANAAVQIGAQGGANANANAGAAVGVKGLTGARAKLAELLATLTVDAQKAAVVEAIAQLDVAISASGEARAAALAEAVAKLNSIKDTLPADAQAVVAEIVAELQAEAGTGTEAGQGENNAGGKSAEVLLQVRAKLAALLPDQASALDALDAHLERLEAAAKAAGATTQAEAQATVAAALNGKAKDKQASAAELDILAHIQAKQGKQAEALATMKARLEANPRTRKAYEITAELDAAAGTQQDLDTYVNGKKVGFDVRPQIESGRTLMPIRALVEALGAQVEWNAETRVVTIIKGETTVSLALDSTLATVNGEEVALEVAAKVVDGRTVVPARFVSEGLGLYVSWLAQHRTIVVTEQPQE